MPGAPTPPILPTAIASAAGGSFITNPMPATPPGSPANAASISAGFPPVTMTSELAGGLPPNGQDVNGFLFLLSSHTLYVECGQLYQYNSTLASDIGGYLAGTVLGMADGTGMWLNVTNGNSTDPDTGGAGWVPLNAYGVGTISGLTGGTVTPTLAQTKYQVLVLSGVLTSNLTLLLPQDFQTWLIVNNTSGAFSTVVKTAASGSTGQTIPQAGPSAPVGVYSIGDGNIYATVAPLSVAIAQAATPSTLVERDNTGAGFFTRVNQSSSLENPTLGAVIVQNSAADGYFRKMSVANFCAAISATLFASPTLTGTPLAPTAAANTRTTQIATTAFANPAATLGAQGSVTLPSGVIIKWGTFSKTASDQGTVLTFPTAFPTNCWAITLADTGGLSFNSSAWVQRLGPITRTNFQCNSDDFGTGSPDPTVTVNYIAIGN